ncbi:hypothetical protein KIPB_013345, partial [Kipferlia bialata]|eukprot:g13345.t1
MGHSLLPSFVSAVECNKIPPHGDPNHLVTFSPFPFTLSVHSLKKGVRPTTVTNGYRPNDQEGEGGTSDWSLVQATPLVSLALSA